MMTIRHVTEYGETIHEVTNVSLDKTEPQTKLYVSGSDLSMTINGGVTYVMNGNGKTVAVYDFTDRDCAKSPLRAA